LVRYEKLPNWFQVCGFLGHEYKDHDDGLHAPQALIFKYLRAKWSIRDGGRPRRGRSDPRGRRRAGMEWPSDDSFGRFSEKEDDGRSDVDMDEDGLAATKKWGPLLNPQNLLNASASSTEKGYPSL
jgi:hypothetical protein